MVAAIEVLDSTPPSRAAQLPQSGLVAQVRSLLLMQARNSTLYPVMDPGELFAWMDGGSQDAPSA